MKIGDLLKTIEAVQYSPGAPATVADDRKADNWIKNYLDVKNKRLNDMRRQLNVIMTRDHTPELPSGPKDDNDPDHIESAWNVYKPSIELEQHPDKIAGGGNWAVTDPEGLIISTWPTEEEANRAAYPNWKGLTPSATGPAGGARVRQLTRAEMQAVGGVNETQAPQDKVLNYFRGRILNRKPPRAVSYASWLRYSDQRPSSHGGGAAGTGGTGSGGGTS